MSEFAILDAAFVDDYSGETIPADSAIAFDLEGGSAGREYLLSVSAITSTGARRAGTVRVLVRDQ